MRQIVDGVYEHLFCFSNTKSVFLKREEGFECARSLCMSCVGRS